MSGWSAVRRPALWRGGSGTTGSGASPTTRCASIGIRRSSPRKLGGRRPLQLAAALWRPPARFPTSSFRRGMYREGAAGVAIAFPGSSYEAMRELKLREREWAEKGRRHDPSVRGLRLAAPRGSAPVWLRSDNLSVAAVRRRRSPSSPPSRPPNRPRPEWPWSCSSRSLPPTPSRGGSGLRSSGRSGCSRR